MLRYTFPVIRDHVLLISFASIIEGGSLGFEEDIFLAKISLSFFQSPSPTFNDAIIP
jgi:hypothetical protein